jgi:hypothetical protein
MAFSFGGIGLGKDSAGLLAERASRNKVTRDRWRNAKTLIIDGYMSFESSGSLWWW